VNEQIQTAELGDGVGDELAGGVAVCQVGCRAEVMSIATFAEVVDCLVNAVGATGAKCYRATFFGKQPGGVPTKAAAAAEYHCAFAVQS
jgi:hypothetical protein